MKRHHFLLLVIVVLSAYIVYNQYKLRDRGMGSGSKIWVYVELKVALKTDTSDYFYFGRVNEDIINEIENNRNTNGLFKLSNIRYWNDDDKLQLYEDESHEGFKVLRISDIYHLKAYKKDPVLIYEEDDLHESAKRARSKYF